MTRLVIGDREDTAVGDIRLGRKLFVHVGPPKTGTSAIQGFLRRHDNSVVIYPKVGLAAGNGHAGLVREFFGSGAERPHPEQNSTLGPILRKISREAAGKDKNVVISSETLAKPYGSCKDVGAFIRGLLPVVSTSAVEVEILVTCREHLSWAASVYNQRVKSKNSGVPEVRSPDEFLRNSGSDLRFAGVIRKLQKTGFKVTVLNYHPSSDCAQRFLMHVGFAPDKVPSLEIRNASLSVPMLIAKIAANKVLGTEKERRSFARMLKSGKKAACRGGPVFGRKVAAEAEERWFAADRQFLWDEFGIQFSLCETNDECGFFLDAGGLAEVAAAVERLGSRGGAILDLAKEYLRT